MDPDPNEVIEQQLRAERPWAAVKLAQARIAELEQELATYKTSADEAIKIMERQESELAEARQDVQTLLDSQGVDKGLAELRARREALLEAADDLEGAPMWAEWLRKRADEQGGGAE